MVFPSTPTQVTNTTPSPAAPRKSSDFPQTGLPLSNGPLGLGGSASPVPVPPGPGPAPPAPSPAPAALPPPSLPPPYPTPMQVSFPFFQKIIQTSFFLEKSALAGVISGHSFHRSLWRIQHLCDF